MDSRQIKKYTNLIILLQSFESLWNFYSISEGELFENETKESAKKLVAYFEAVYNFDSKVYNSKELTINSTDDEVYMRERLNGLSLWSENRDKFPFLHQGLGPNESSRCALQAFLMCSKVYLCRKLEVEVFPNIIMSSGEASYTKNNIRWTGHLPWQALDIVDGEYVENLSNSDTIVLVADIRKSQDLMTYGPNPDFFRDKILEFTTETRKIIKNNFGIFDKFTGDGFLCYFNSHLCSQFGKNYYKQFVLACDEIMKFSDTFFSEWVKSIRKLPPNSSGLTIGVDSGVVKFRDLDNHLFAIGDAIVWANRMSSVGKKGEIILNNIPYHRIISELPDLKYEIIESMTKGGEAFTAYKLLK